MDTNDQEAVTTQTGDTGTDDADMHTGADQGTDDTKRSFETDEAKLSRLRRMTAQLEKKLGKGTVQQPQQAQQTESKAKDNTLDYGQKSYLLASGVKPGEETELVQQIMSDTGKSLEDVLSSRYFQAELKEMRENASAQAATPSGTKRSNSTPRDTVEYWLAKGELPPMDQVELRRKVVNAKISKNKTVSVFTKHPVV